MCSIPELKPLELYIGTNEAQNAVVYPLDQLPHLLVCGMNGCGRSSFLRALQLSAGADGTFGAWDPGRAAAAGAVG